MINTGDTAWVLVCTGLVMLMTPGLAFFYGGMVRREKHSWHSDAVLYRALHPDAAVDPFRL